MGLTIHYEGSLADSAAYDVVVARVKASAEHESWPFEMINLVDQKLERIIANEDPEEDEEVVEYSGPLNGISVTPSPDCEPFTLAFGSDLFCQDYTKTQFAGPDVHRKLVLLLDELRPLFSRLNVFDEADYWANRNDEALETNFLRAREAVNEAQSQYERVASKVRTPVGRLIDLLLRPFNRTRD